MAKVDFDFRGFFKAVDAIRNRKHMSWRKVADATGLSASSLTRLQQGRGLDVDGLGALARWAILDLDDYFNPPVAETVGADSAEKLVALLRADSTLDENVSSMLEATIRAAYEIEGSRSDE